MANYFSTNSVDPATNANFNCTVPGTLQSVAYGKPRMGVQIGGALARVCMEAMLTTKGVPAGTWGPGMPSVDLDPWDGQAFMCNDHEASAAQLYGLLVETATDIWERSGQAMDDGEDYSILTMWVIDPAYDAAVDEFALLPTVKAWCEAHGGTFTVEL